jgi:diphthamide biosynthesis protein 2
MSTNSTHPAVAPVLSTPDTHIFEAPAFTTASINKEVLRIEELIVRYEIDRTVREIRSGGWKRVALQFEDSMLPHAIKVYEILQSSLNDPSMLAVSNTPNDVNDKIDLEEKSWESDVQHLTVAESTSAASTLVKLFILADTSYGACCVDEIAAEHVDADVVIHYGRSCLSPTARLPVIYVFTARPLDVDKIVDTFQKTYLDKDSEIIVMADVPFSVHQKTVVDKLQTLGYTNVFNTEIVHNPSSVLPNRTLPPNISQENHEILKHYSIFHIGLPPTALLLTLASRVAAIHIHDPSQPFSLALTPNKASSFTLRRRYALVTSLATVSVFGVLVNTLSVANYQHVVSHVTKQIAQAGKKSYTFVVGKVNAAKIANFAEIGGWVVIGCWESSLVESDEFYRPLITPLELEIALKGDGRIWTGEWRSDFASILENSTDLANGIDGVLNSSATPEESKGDDDYDDEEDSEPPEFDLRTGRYISHSRPMRITQARDESKSSAPETASAPNALMKRAHGDLAQIGGQASPGAEFLRQNRTWQGLGSDFATDFTQEGAVVEEGRSGVARGYTVGEPTMPR